MTSTHGDPTILPDYENSNEFTEKLSTERTAVFFCDSRASTVMLGETVSLLIATKHIERGILDINSAPGRVVAAEFHKAGLPYSALSTDQPLPTNEDLADITDLDGEFPSKLDDPAYLLQQAAGIVEVDPERYHEINANIVLVPAMVGSGQVHIDLVADHTNGIDLSPTTLPGVVIEQCQLADRDVLLIDPPERGLVQRPGGGYQRRIMHLGMEASPEETHAYNTAAHERDDEPAQDREQEA